jgi:glucose/arabinose dehydrogenase
VALEPVADGFRAPLYLTHAGDGSERMFVVEKRGTIAILHDGRRVERPFLDITNLVGSDASEQGLLSVAFHPRYTANGHFFVNYTDRAGDTVIARYAVSSDPDQADPDSALTLLTIDQPAANHNGGLVMFGPDSYLYIGMGDGGRAGDPWGNAQNPQALLGKLLRIDVDNGDPYGIPQDNPFADGQAGRPEVWALGLRNPWRFSFDRAGGALWVADVGQNAYEEINLQQPGQGGLNYGWNITEGLHCFRGASCDTAAFLEPVAEYSHDQGCSVTGGYVYRGKSFPQLAGAYFFGDYCSGLLWSLTGQPGAAWSRSAPLETDLRISSFGEDEAGELYLLSIGEGRVYQIVAS